MPRVGFEPTIPVFERTKTVHALDGAVTLIGSNSSLLTLICILNDPLHINYIYIGLN
jgi:hypothetical protein